MLGVRPRLYDPRHGNGSASRGGIPTGLNPMFILSRLTRAKACLRTAFAAVPERQGFVVALALLVEVSDRQVQNFMKHIRPHIIDDFIPDRVQNV